MSLTEYDRLTANVGWDGTIAHLVINKSSLPEDKVDDILLLCKMYDMAYEATDYQNSDYDSDYGLCYDIREFCINAIRDLLKNS